MFRALAPKIVAKQARDQGTGRKAVAAVCEDAARHFDAINTLVADGGWLVGDGPSIADIAVVSMLTVLDRAEEARAVMEGHSALQKWRLRVDALTLPPGTSEGDKALV
jgi:glutathione S-transferase